MNTLNVPTTRDLLRSLQSNLCPICGKLKIPRQTLCRPCYSRLGSRTKRALYARVGDGYEEAVHEAMIALGVLELQLP